MSFSNKMLMMGRRVVSRVGAFGKPTSEEQLIQYAKGNVLNFNMGMTKAAGVVGNMEMIGMKEFKVVLRMVVPQEMLKEKVHVGLEAKGVPQEVAQSIAFELDGSKF